MVLVCSVSSRIEPNLFSILVVNSLSPSISLPLISYYVVKTIPVSRYCISYTKCLGHNLEVIVTFKSQDGSKNVGVVYIYSIYYSTGRFHRDIPRRLSLQASCSSCDGGGIL